MKAAEAVRLLAGAFAENGPPRRKLKDTVVGRVGNRVVDDVFCPEWSTPPWIYTDIFGKLDKTSILN